MRNGRIGQGSEEEITGWRKWQTLYAEGFRGVDITKKTIKRQVMQVPSCGFESRSRYERKERKMRYWDKSITLVEGCSPVSEGCVNCWRKAIDHRFGREEFVGKDGNWTGKIRTREDRLPKLMKGKDRVIQIWNDLYNEQVPDGFIYEVYDYIANPCHDNTVLILTKRAKRMKEYLVPICNEIGPPPDNIWHGVTTENQRTADDRIPYLLQVSGKLWLSVEPLLEEIHMSGHLATCECGYIESEHGDPAVPCQKHRPAIHQVVVGCETGRNARPCKIEWIESIVDQCKQAGVPVFVKAVNINGKITSDITKFPESLRVRELAWKSQDR